MKGKVSIVTGGGQGIGEGISRALARAGAKVVVNDLVRERAEGVARDLKEMGADALGLQADVSNEAHVERLVKEVIERFGRIDILVNNAGLAIVHEGKKALIWEMEVEEWDRMLAVNLKAAFLCSKVVLRTMIKTGVSGGRIINISSVAARAGFISSVAYIASKAGVIGLTKVMAREVAPYGITVNAVTPGVVDTPMMALSTTPERYKEICEMIPLGRWATPQDIAGTVIFLASNAASYITGATIDVNGGWVMY